MSKLDDAIRKVDELTKKLAKLTKKPVATYDLSNLKKANIAINSLEDSIELATNKANELEEGFGGISKAIGAAVAEMDKASTPLNRTKKAMRGINSIVGDLKAEQEGYNKLSLDDLKSHQEKLKTLTQEAKTQAKLVSKQYEKIALDKNGNKLSKTALAASLKKEGITQKEFQSIRSINAAHQAGLGILQEANDKLDERVEKSKKVKKTIGLTGAALAGIGKIPILGDIIDTEEALKAAEKAAEGGAGKIKSMSAAFGNLGKQLGKAFTDPLFIIGGIIKSFKMLLKLGFQFDNQVTQLSKSFGTSKQVAEITRDRMAEIQENSEDVLMTINNQVTAQSELNDMFGTQIRYSDEMVASQIKLTKRIGLNAEEAKGINELALISGKTTDDVTKSVIKQNIALYKQTGIRLSDKKVLQDIAKVQGQLRAQYKNNPDLIAAAVVQAKQLGIEMEQAKKMADGLLDFEKSIEDELTAELLTGKDLNLERARGLALEGKSVEAAKEMLKEVKSVEEFSNMNVLAQQAMADAVNMTTDELANSLVQQDNLKNLSKQTQENIEKQVEALRAKGEHDQANILMNSLGDEKQAERALARISAQEEFNAGMEKLQAIIGEILKGPAMKLAQFMGAFLSDTEAIKSVFKGIVGVVAGLGAIKLSGLLAQLGTALVTTGAMSASAMAYASAITLGLGLFAVVAGIYTVASAMNSVKTPADKVNDMIMPGDGAGGYGKRTLVGPEGAIQLNNKDTVIAGTDLFGDDVKSESGKPTELKKKGDIEIKSGGADMSETNALLNSILSAIEAGSIITMDGNQVGESINVGSRELQ
jgi:hypothetical protein